MDKQRRKALVEQYQEIKVYMGIARITNTRSGKIFISASPNLKNRWQTLRWQLDAGTFPNVELQRDWRELGSDAFAFDVLEQVEIKDDTDVRWELKKLEKAWLARLQPYGEAGYNRPAKGAAGEP